jgi:putative ABC transport system substrate-binding protein
MNRRDATTALVALGTAGPFVARAQSKPSAQSKVLGVLTLVASQDAKRLWLDGFHAKLKALGWIEGQNLVIESAFADYKADRLAELAEELVRKRVDAIWTYQPEAAIAAARATKTIPIVFIGVAWPVEQGLIDSFARPGRNATGVSSYTGIEVSTKRLEFLKEIVPTATRLSWIQDSGLQATVDGKRFEITPLLDSAAGRLGYEVRHHDISRTGGLDRAFAETLDWRAEAIAVAGSLAIFAARERIAAFALLNRLPSAFAGATLVEAGGLLSYSAAGGFNVLIPRSVEYVDRIFRGARAADLAVDRPERYELVINLKTAKALGLQIPQSVLLRADRVIE